MSETISTYNRGALALGKKFNEIGPRIEDVKRAFSYIQKKNPKVIELGCGNGRDAKEILKFTTDYVGIDASSEMIKLAQDYLPEATFVISEIETFTFPLDVGIIFAFASLLHLNKESVKEVLKKAHVALTTGGVFYISVKLDKYHERIKKDEFGERVFYYYDQSDMKQLAQETGYEIVYEDTQELKGTKWLTVALKRV